MDLTDDQWNAIQSLLPQELNQGAGRPPQSSRRVLDAILWKLRTGAAWNDLPPHYPSHQTCFRRFTAWERSGLLEAVFKALSKHLSRSGFNLQKAIQDKEIEMVTVAKKSHLRFAPRWQDTWQASTALLLIQRHLAKQRRQGQPLPKLALSHPVEE
jgi:transposase